MKMSWSKIEQVVKDFILAPIRECPVAFLFYGFLLFLPEMFQLMSWERGVYLAEHFFTTVAFCFTVSWIICLIAKCLGKRSKRIFHCVLHVIILFINLTDVVIFKFFRLRLGVTAFELVLQTNGGETKEFIQAYLSNTEVLAYLVFFLVIICVEIVCALWLQRYIVLVLRFFRKDGWILGLFAIGVFNVFYFFSPTYIPNRTHIHTFDEPILEQNVLWAIKNGTQGIAEMQAQIENLEKSITDLRLDSSIKLIPYEFEEIPSSNIVLIIGETYNKYHSPLYGYTLQTTRRQQGFEPIIFQDVITPIPSTHDAFRAILSTNSAHDPWAEAPLFPALFKGNGWNVAFFSNQFIKGLNPSMLDFLVDATLNRPKVDAACFNFHNKERYDFDGEFVDDFLKKRPIIEAGEKNLTIVHFLGQHMAYGERYPAGQGHFTLDSIARPELDEEGKTWVMHYDNATFYNDIQIGRILEAYKDDDAIIIATADHGEEVYDFRPKAGRSMLDKDDPAELIKTHVDVPFLVFTTEKYKETHPKTISLLESAASKPFMIDDLTHILLHLGGIHTAWYDAKKNPLHPEYDTTKHRILKIRGIDYDEKCRGEFRVGY